MANGYRRHSGHRCEAHTDEERGDDGDGHPESGHTLQESAKRPGQEQQLHRRLGGQPRNPLSDDGDGPGFVDNAIQHQRHPDDIQHIQCKQQAPYLGIQQHIRPGAKEQPGHQDGRQPTDGASLFASPTETNHQHQYNRDGQKGQEPGE